MEEEWEPSASDMLPIFIRVQDLQKRLLEHEDTFNGRWNWVDAYLLLLHGEASEQYMFLRQALLARRVIMLLDGIDEAGKVREQLERHINTVLAPQGHMIMLTSRPSTATQSLGADGLWKGFHRLQLSTLSDSLQQCVYVAGPTHTSFPLMDHLWHYASSACVSSRYWQASD